MNSTNIATIYPTVDESIPLTFKINLTTSSD